VGEEEEKGGRVGKDTRWSLTSVGRVGEQQQGKGFAPPRAGNLMGI